MLKTSEKGIKTRVESPRHGPKGFYIHLKLRMSTFVLVTLLALGSLAALLALALTLSLGTRDALLKAFLHNEPVRVVRTIDGGRQS